MVHPGGNPFWISDLYTMNNSGTYHFLEVGKVQGTPKVLFSVLGPTYNPDDGNLCGIAGMAMKYPYPFYSAEISHLVKTAEQLSCIPTLTCLAVLDCF